MRVKQGIWSAKEGWTGNWNPETDRNPVDFILAFGSPAIFKDRALKDLQEIPGALIGCSTAGEIFDTKVFDDTLSATAVTFEKSRVKGRLFSLDRGEHSFDVGRQIGETLGGKDLRHVLVFSEGIHVNGSELVGGLESALPAGVTVTGGLSGDGEQFRETRVIFNDEVRPRAVAALGLYGEHLEFGCASMGGWDSFGTERLVTRSSGNILYELDGKSALELYKTYLGEQAADLPASGLLYPLSLRPEGGGTGVVRTILSVDEKEGSLTFAGDIPENSYVRLMKANFNRLVDGAVGAARASVKGFANDSPDLALLISCVGRKMVLGQRTEEEVESVRDVLGMRTCITGFYSYGEISPFTPEARCQLHNQTMTITTVSEK